MPRGHSPLRPSPWVERFIPLLPHGRPVLDLACGGGRHSLLLLESGFQVTSLDRDASQISSIFPLFPNMLEILETDLEDGTAYPLGDRLFGGVIVTNYLHRPILPDIIANLEPGGALIYETFALGNERYGKPSNPDFLLRPGELLEAVQGQLLVKAYEDLIVEDPKPAAVQRICAVRS